MFFVYCKYGACREGAGARTPLSVPSALAQAAADAGHLRKCQLFHKLSIGKHFCIRRKTSFKNLNPRFFQTMKNVFRNLYCMLTGVLFLEKKFLINNIKYTHIFLCDINIKKQFLNITSRESRFKKTTKFLQLLWRFETQTHLRRWI